MSHDRSTNRLAGVAVAGSTAVAARRATVRLLTGVSFWVAVCLPFVLVGMLATGLATPGQARVFLGLTGLELVALVVGRAHPTAA